MPVCDYDALGVLLANHFQDGLTAACRGTALLEDIGDGELALVVFGKRLWADRRVRVESRATLGWLTLAGFEEVGSSFSRDGTTWAVVARLPENACHTIVGKRFAAELLRGQLEDALARVGAVETAGCPQNG